MGNCYDTLIFCFDPEKYFCVIWSINYLCKEKVYYDNRISIKAYNFHSKGLVMFIKDYKLLHKLVFTIKLICKAATN